MSAFAVMVFSEEKKAYEALHALRELHAEGSVTVWGTDVLQRGEDGRITVLKSGDVGPVGTGVGVLTGGLVGLFGGPVGGAIGAAVGAAAGGVRDLVHVGVSDEFLAAVERDLAPGKFAGRSPRSRRSGSSRWTCGWRRSGRRSSARTG